MVIPPIPVENDVLDIDDDLISLESEEPNLFSKAHNVSVGGLFAHSENDLAADFAEGNTMSDAEALPLRYLQ